MRSLAKDEATTVRATILSRMGTASKGRQDATGDVFSPAQFVTEWNGLSPRAKSALFPDGEHRAAINDLATVMDGMKKAQLFENTLKTGIAVGGSAHLAGFTVAPLTTTLLVASEFGLGKLLASPGFAPWLARTPAQSNSALRLHVTRLGNVAGREAVIGADIKALQERLREAFGQSPVRAAANDKEQD